MDESLQQLQDELKALQPRRAPAHWLNQINRELAAELPASARPRYTTATNLGSWKWLGWRAAATAAAIAVVAVIAMMQLKQTPPAAKEPAGLVAPIAKGPAAAVDDHVYQPVAAANVLYDVKDEGAVKTGDNSTARQVRARYVDTYTWKNPRTNASLKWTVPRDEVRVIPATYHPN